MRTLIPIAVLAALPLTTLADPPTTQSDIHTVRFTESRIVNPDDPPVVTRTTVDDREKGSLELEVHAHGTYVTREIPGKSIRYRLGRSKAQLNPFGYEMTPERLNFTFQHLSLNAADNPTRDPDRDLNLDGQKLLAYALRFPNSKNEYTEWADDAGLIHRQESVFPGDRYSKSFISRNEREFNPTLPSDFWNDPPGLEMVDIPKEFEKAHPLASALWTREIDGNTLAVESVSRDADGDIFVITSWRQNEANRLAALKDKRSISLPTMFLAYVDPTTHKRGPQWRDIPFATMNAPGVALEFHFIVPQSPDLATDHAAFSFQYAYNPSPPDFKSARPVSPEPPPYIPFDLKIENATDTITNFAGKAFDALDPFDGLTFRFQLDLGTTRSSSQQDTSFAAYSRESFQSHVARYLEVHQRMQAERPPPRPTTLP